jgi:pimeloyl-[acyl-carrier protein] methyl ester esterase
MKLHQHSIGHGPDLVLLHGWGLHSGIWSAGRNSLAEQLAQHYRITMIDLPGHGHSDGLGHNGFTFDATVAAIAAQLPPTAMLLGWSLGGLLAQRLACQRPQQVSRLILLASTARFTRADDWPGALPTATLDNFGLALVEDPQATIQRFLALQVRGSDNERQQLRILKQALAERPQARAEALRSGLDILRQVDLRPGLADIAQPTLLIFGQHDRIVPASAGPAMAGSLPQVHSLTLAGAGHAPFLSHPAQTGQAILEFLNDR